MRSASSTARWSGSRARASADCRRPPGRTRTSGGRRCRCCGPARAARPGDGQLPLGRPAPAVQPGGVGQQLDPVRVRLLEVLGPDLQPPVLLVQGGPQPGRLGPERGQVAGRGRRSCSPAAGPGERGRGGEGRGGEQAARRVAVTATRAGRPRWRPGARVGLGRGDGMGPPARRRAASPSPLPWCSAAAPGLWTTRSAPTRLRLRSPPGGSTTAGRVAACLGTGDAGGGSGASSGTPGRRGGAWSATGGRGGVRHPTGGLVAAPPPRRELRRPSGGAAGPRV
jgi:hypothetical protein